MNTIAKILLFIFLLLIAVVSAQAQESGITQARHAVGFSGGGVIGTGLTYRLYTSRSFVQGTFFGRVTSQDDINNVMAGLSYGRILSEISIVKALPPTALLFVGGIDGRYSKSRDVEGVTSNESETERSLRTGAGIALEIGNTFSPGLLFSIGTTYALAIEQQDTVREWSLGPEFAVGILYNW